jgi:hypothetical protein
MKRGIFLVPGGSTVQGFRCLQAGRCHLFHSTIKRTLVRLDLLLINLHYFLSESKLNSGSLIK